MTLSDKVIQVTESDDYRVNSQSMN